MENREFYNTIFKRKSVRSYVNEPLSGEKIDEIKSFARSLKPLYPDIQTELKIISGEDVKSLIPQKKAPHYIAVFSENQEGYLTNIGFMLQQMDLYLSANGIGSCWQGIPKPSKEVLKTSRLEFVILIAFGNPKEELHRRISQFKRNSLTDITDMEGMDELLEPVRIAPSATNSQPWYFTGNNGLIHCYCKKLNFLKAKLLAKWNKIDMGIAIYHLTVSARHHKKSVEIIQDQDGEANPPKGYYYIASVIIN
ncbi:MAG: nitroreductase family protein [Methanobacteriaceae archaeon]|nr:nitroreductase family protein [Methanobacteriaceae archaeon]